MRPTSPALPALMALALAGCLFDEEPPCRIGGSGCPPGLVCLARACVLPSMAGGDAAPDAARDAAVDATPDGRPLDQGPTDHGVDDRGPADDGPSEDAAVAPEPDIGPTCADERCNGLDDDCDGRVDEALMPCGVINLDVCHWRHRGHHAYLFCDRPVPQAEALDLCTRQYGLRPAVPETCDESTWLWATGNLVPAPVEWGGDARGRAWWLGLTLGIPDDGATLGRIDGVDAPLPEGGCWGPGEPDETLRGESCVDLLYNPRTGAHGWNDDLCGNNALNPVNALCEARCDPTVDADGDGEDACVDCDDRDPRANGGEGLDRCPRPPADGFPP